MNARRYFAARICSYGVLFCIEKIYLAVFGDRDNVDGALRGYRAQNPKTFA